MTIETTHERLNDDFYFFAEHAPLLIKTKEGGDLVKFVPNKAQRYIHRMLEDQRRRKGWVRALLLKGRQQGGSTYVNARYYHKASRHRGISVFILSHEGKTTDKLFDMVKRFQDNVDARIKPAEGKSNTRQLVFSGLGSDYAAGTAGNEQVGRGGTAQLFHGSEAAYWEHAYAIQDGALKSIGLVPGTEIILESTANGPLGLFYEKCQQALLGQGDYILIFVPWFWQDEYEREFDGSPLDDEETEFIKTYFTSPFPDDRYPISKEKALRKIMWRRAEILDLSTANNSEIGKAKFRQIYPSNPIEAFLSSGVGLFRADAIMAARKNIELVDPTAPLVAGVDPAGDSDRSDRTVISLRRGRVLEEVMVYPSMTPMRLAGIVATEVIEKRGALMAFIDRGYGEGTIDRLNEMGYGRRVMGIAFNERALQENIYLNKRSEIIIETAKWLNAGGVRIPDRDDIHADLACMPLDQETSNGLKFIPSKREIKKSLGGRSTDILDSLALTFSYPVRRDVGGQLWRKADPGARGFAKGGGGLISLAKKRRMG